MKRILLILLLFAPSCFGAAPVIVQCTTGTYFSNTTQGNLTFPNPVTAGDGIIAFPAYNATTTVSVTDSENNAYTLASGFPVTVVSDFNRMSVYYSPNVVAGSTIVHLNLSPAAFAEMVACEVAIQSKSSMIDVSAGNSGSSGSASVGPVTTTGTDLVFGFFINQANNAFTVGGGWASQTVFGTTNSLLETQTQGGAGAITATATLTSSPWGAVIVAIKPATTASLSSIAVTPNPASTQAGNSVQFTATGTYSDSSQFNLTGASTWSSTNTTVATAAPFGVVTTISLAGGTTTIGASFQSVNGSSVLTSTPATFDHFGGLVSVPGSGHPNKVNATCSQSAFTISCTITNPSSFLYAANEPMKIAGTGTAMDWIFVPKNPQAGMPIIQSVTGNPITSMTLTSPVSQTVGSASGTISPGKFYVQTITTAFGTGPQFITPEDHWIWIQGVAAVGTPLPTTKYGSTVTAAQQIQNGFQSLGFNAIAPLSDDPFVASKNNGGTYAGNTRLPFWSDQQIGLYSTKALGGFVSQPIHDMRPMVNAHFSCGGANHSTQDFFDARWLAHMEGYSQFFDSSVTQYYQSPYFVGHTTDDTDFVGMPNAGWNFHTIVLGVNDCDYSLKAFIASPMSSVGNYSSLYGGGQAAPVIYFDPLLYSKVPAISPPATCAIATPCTLADFLKKKYVTCAALNTAWSSTYDCTAGNSGFGSTGSGVGYTYSWLKNTNATPDTLCTGTGSSTTCNFTLATGSEITGFSLQVILTPSGGSPQVIGGDCPNYSPNGGCGGSVGVGSILGPGIWKASIKYPSGQVITDSFGDIELLTTAGNPAGISGSPTPSWPAAGSCTGSQTTTDGPLTWKCLGTGISSGTITYATRAVAITTNNNLANGATYKANYVADGWGTTLGAGLLDEDGRHTAWVGTDYMCVVSLPAFQINHLYALNDEIHDTVSGSWQFVTVGGTSAGSAPTFSSVGGTLTTSGGATFESIGKPVCGSESGSDFGPPNANQTLAQDIAVTWQSQLAGQYFGTWNTMLRTIYPGTLDGCADNLSTWQTPSRAPVLDAANNYCDWAYHQSTLMNVAFEFQSLMKYSFMTQHFTHPLVGFQTPVSVESASACGGNVPCTDTQAIRGQVEYSTINTSLNQLSYNGTFQTAGYVHWTANDFFGGQNANFGFKTGNVATRKNSFFYTVPTSGSDIQDRGFFLDSNGNLEQATTPGVTASSDPGTYPSTCTGTQTTVDGTLTATCLGPWPLDNLYDGHENVSAIVSCSPPLQAFNCGGQPANFPYNGKSMFSGAQNLKTGLALWNAGSAPPPPVASTPTAAPPAGTYPTVQNVTLTTTSAGAIICWNFTGAPATNGTNGCSNGTLYVGAINTFPSATIYAVAGGTNWTDSPVGSFLYSISPPPPSGSGSLPPLIIITSADKCKLMTPSDELCKGYDDLNNLLGSCIVCGL